MRWAAPEWFAAGLVVLAAVVWILRYGFRRRRKTLNDFADEGLQATLVPAKRLKHRRAAAVCCAAGVLFAVITLMRPQWGSRLEKVPRLGIDLVFVLDVSNSMLSEDILPSRLERAKLAIGDLVKRLGGDRVGLIAFAGDAYLACPLTADYGGFLLTLADIGPDAVGRGGTDIAAAFKTAKETFKSAASRDKTLILITDGEDQEGRALAAAKDLHATQGVRIYTIGVGTREGELIPLRDRTGKVQFLKDDQGQAVKSRLDEDLLEKIALATEGVYVRSCVKEFGLDFLYNNYFTALEKTRGEERTVQIYTERFPAFLLLALIAFIAQCIFEEL